MSCPLLPLFITNWLLHQRGSWPIVIFCMGPNFLYCNQSNNDMKKSHIGLPKVTLDCPKWHWIVQSHIGLAIFEIKLTLIRNKVTFDWPKWQKISNLWNQSNNDIKSHRIAQRDIRFAICNLLNQNNNDIKSHLIAQSDIGLPKVTLDCPNWHRISQSDIRFAIFPVKCCSFLNCHLEKLNLPGSVRFCTNRY